MSEGKSGDNASDRPVGRRSFFRVGLRELLRPLAGTIDTLVKTAEEVGKLDQPKRGSTTKEAAPLAPGAVRAAGSVARGRSSMALPVWIRPPGALEESIFRDTCSVCGECVAVCPAKCIKIDPIRVKGNGLPYIDVDAMPCAVCTGLQCMNHCPSGALVPTPLGEIDMGTAVWRAESCVRSFGQDCTICIDQCPLGSAAIELRDGRVKVIEEGCIGCGACQYYCPTTPKSIVVQPRGG